MRLIALQSFIFRQNHYFSKINLKFSFQLLTQDPSWPIINEVQTKKVSQHDFLTILSRIFTHSKRFLSQIKAINYLKNTKSKVLYSTIRLWLVLRRLAHPQSRIIHISVLVKIN